MESERALSSALAERLEQDCTTNAALSQRFGLQGLEAVISLVDSPAKFTHRPGVSMSTFEGRLAFARTVRRYGSRELGREAGLSAAAVSKLERPRADPKLSTITLLARVLQCDPAWLAWGVGEVPVETDADRQRMPPPNARRRHFIPVRRESPRQALPRRRARQGGKGER